MSTHICESCGRQIRDPDHCPACAQTLAGTHAPNSNCLEGFACPECGQSARFQITCESVATVSDDGVEDHDGHVWSDTSTCVCPDCGHDGMVKEFCP